MVCHQLCAWGENKEWRSGRNTFAESHQGLSLNSARGCFHAFNSQSNELFIFVADKIPYFLVHPFYCQNKRGWGKRGENGMFFNKYDFKLLIAFYEVNNVDIFGDVNSIRNYMHLRYECHAWFLLNEFFFFWTKHSPVDEMHLIKDRRTNFHKLKLALFISNCRSGNRSKFSPKIRKKVTKRNKPD